MDAQFGRVIGAGDGELDFDVRRVLGNFTSNGYPIEAITRVRLHALPSVQGFDRSSVAEFRLRAWRVVEVSPILLVPMPSIKAGPVAAWEMIWSRCASLMETLPQMGFRVG